MPKFKVTTQCTAAVHAFAFLPSFEIHSCVRHSYLCVVACRELDRAVRHLHPQDGAGGHSEPNFGERVSVEHADELELFLLDVDGRPLVARDVFLGELPQDISSRRCFGGSDEVGAAGCVLCSTKKQQRHGRRYVVYSSSVES